VARYLRLLGGGVGLGFGNQYKVFPGGEGCFYAFVQRQAGTKRDAPSQADGIFRRHGHADDFLHGERYLKTPQVVEKFVDNLPIVDIPAKYVVVNPCAT